MTESDDRLERLISRVLDREASSAERRELNRRTLADPRAAQLYEEYAALDREIGAALRSAMRPARRLFPGPLWRRIGQAGMLAVAACLALVIWMRPPLPGRTSARTPEHAGMTPLAAPSWFSSPAPAVDVVEAPRPVDERPQVRLQSTNRQWLVIPGRRPGELLLIQADHVKSRAVPVQEDF